MTVPAQIEMELERFSSNSNYVSRLFNRWQELWLSADGMSTISLSQHTPPNGHTSTPNTGFILNSPSATSFSSTPCHPFSSRTSHHRLSCQLAVSILGFNLVVFSSNAKFQIHISRCSVVIVTLTL